MPRFGTMNNNCRLETTHRPILRASAGSCVFRKVPLGASTMQKRNTPACVSTHNKTPERRLVDGNQMAEAISVSPKTLQRLRNDGIIGFYRIGRTLRYDIAEVMDALTDYHVKSRAQLVQPQ